MTYALVALEVQTDGTCIVGASLATGCTPDAAKANFMHNACMDPSDFAPYVQVWCEANNMQLLCIKLQR